MSTAQAAYVVLEKNAAFEVRRYEPHVLAVSRESDLRGYSGFNVLFDYISGGNRESKKISMTAPVLNNLDDKPLTTAFVMPSGLTLANLPQPNASGPDLVEVPARYNPPYLPGFVKRNELLVEVRQD